MKVNKRLFDDAANIIERQHHLCRTGDWVDRDGCCCTLGAIVVAGGGADARNDAVGWAVDHMDIAEWRELRNLVRTAIDIIDPEHGRASVTSWSDEHATQELAVRVLREAGELCDAY